MTPAQYLKSLRMWKAKELLEETFLNVKQIMLRVGVKDQSHFVRDFRGLYGHTPTKYRRRVRG
jgi:transcriptional regulator GlxA family with amidase domain